MRKNRLLYLGGLAGAVAFHIFYFGWYSWFVLVLALALPGFSLLVSLPDMCRMRLRLGVPERCQRGEKALAVLRLAAGPGGGACRLRWTARCAATGKALSVQRTLRGSGELRVPLDTGHCALLRCGVERSRALDGLGLLGLPVRRGGEREVLVCPVPTPPETLPELTPFLAAQYRPKPGGGFAEQYENRAYRPGDSLRDIHWKLSAKTDSLIVREAQEPGWGRCLLTFDLTAPGEALDQVLDQLVWLSGWLLDHGVAHQVLWTAAEDGTVDASWIRQREDLLPLLRQVLRAPVGAALPSLADRSFPDAAWRYHILPKRGVSG